MRAINWPEADGMSAATARRRPVQLGFLLRRQLLLPGHGRRRFLIILLGLRPGFCVILLRLPGFLVTTANQRIRISQGKKKRLSFIKPKYCNSKILFFLLSSSLATNNAEGFVGLASRSNAR